jgi:hypothetical protein
LLLRTTPRQSIGLCLLVWQHNPRWHWLLLAWRQISLEVLLICVCLSGLASQILRVADNLLPRRISQRLPKIGELSVGWLRPERDKQGYNSNPQYSERTAKLHLL